jgi:L-arabinokinase
MYRILHGSTEELADVKELIETLADLRRHPLPQVRELFDPDGELFIARAPGRLDVMGGIADYSGSLVLQLPIQEAALVALQKVETRDLNIISLNGDATQRSHWFQMSLADFEAGQSPISYAEARAFFRRQPDQSWAAYIAGAFLVLMREQGIQFKQGAHLLIDSRVPEGKGVSSSAAIEVAAMNAILAAYDISLLPRDLALLCQKVENEVVGAPCGVMDQMTAECGEVNRLMALLCQPAELQAERRLPESVGVWGIDSGVRHSVGAGDYGSVRTGAFMGYRIIAELAGLSVTGLEAHGKVSIDDRLWKGYLANLTPEEFQQFESRLPEQISGADFLSRYQGITDSVTDVQSDRNYAVRLPTAHPIYENARVHRFASLLQETISEDELKILGKLMLESHASYSACGLGSEGTDLLVELVRTLGTGQGLYGAKITGGGSGGTVAVIGRRDAAAAIYEIADEYRKRTAYQPFIFSNSSIGAAQFGHLKIQLAG